jgi:lysophospholipase L1-like esterase
MKIAPNSTLLFIGDSITDAGRDLSGEPTAWAPHVGLGIGYVNLVNALITAQRPGDKIRVINRGVSGNTVLDLKTRWEQDVLAYNADWLAVMIGINDVWRQFDSPLRADLHVGIDTYESTLDELLTATRARLQLQGLVLLSPFVFIAQREDAMRAQMDRYGAVVQRLAEKHGAIFVDVQAALDHLMEHRHPTGISWDRIHPDTVGHMAIAQAFLQAVE